MLPDNLRFNGDGLDPSSYMKVLFLTDKSREPWVSEDISDLMYAHFPGTQFSILNTGDPMVDTLLFKPIALKYLRRQKHLLILNCTAKLTQEQLDFLQGRHSDICLHPTDGKPLLYWIIGNCALSLGQAEMEPFVMMQNGHELHAVPVPWRNSIYMDRKVFDYLCTGRDNHSDLSFGIYTHFIQDYIHGANGQEYPATFCIRVKDVRRLKEVSLADDYWNGVREMMKWLGKDFL